MPRFSTENFRSPAALACYVLTTLVGLSLDLWTKALATTHLRIGNDVFVSRTVEFIPGFLHFNYHQNEGAVFGIGQGHRWFFVAVSVLAIAFLSWLFAVSGRQRLYQFTLGLLLGGVLGNLYDRVVYGYVRDMIHIFPAWGIFPWIFNVADSLLCVGVALLILHSIFGGVQEEPDSGRLEAAD